MAGKISRTSEDRFDSMVAESNVDECAIWLGSLNQKGYGRFWNKGRTMGAHRFAWIRAHGQFDESKLRVLHRCDNPWCVNPRHLFLGTLTENMADRDAKGRQAKGERNGNRKLTEEQALAIKRSVGSDREVAKQFGIDASQVWNIRSGRQWRYLNG